MGKAAKDGAEHIFVNTLEKHKKESWLPKGIQQKLRAYSPDGGRIVTNELSSNVSCSEWRKNFLRHEIALNR